MKKLFTLLTLLVALVTSAWANEAVISWYMGGNGTAATSANSITGASGCAAEDFVIAITGNTGKSWSNGNGDITYNSTNYKTLKNSNGAQNTITCPSGKVATQVKFYVVTNDASTKGKLSEFDGTSCNDEVSSLKDYSNPTVITKNIDYKGSFTFTFSTKQVCFIAVVTYTDAVTKRNITWNNGGHGTAPTSPTNEATFTLPTMDPDGGYVNTGWKADQIVKVAGADVAANTEIAVGTSVTLTANTTFTGVWKAPSTFALTSDEEVEVVITGTSTITSENAAGTLTYASADESIATVSASGVISAVAGGKTTITVTDPGSTDVAGGSATVTVLVPYANPAAADSYVLNQDTYAFSNTANTKYYFTNGFTMTPNTTASLDNGGLANSKKYSHARVYTIKTPSNVTVTYAIITARNNYKNEKSNPAANWGTVFGTDYSSEGNLPWSNEDPVEKEFVVASPSAGAELVFQPGGNQWQAIINLYTIAYHAKYAVTFDKGEGTGTMEGTEVRGGSTYVLPASTFTPPSEKGFAGWLCDIDGLVYDAGADYTMTDAATTFTAQYAGVEGKMIIRATPTASNAATVTGAIGGTADVNLQDGGSDGWKFGGDTHHIGITLASGWTFKAGDVINVHITKASENGGIIFYNSDQSIIYNTGDLGVVGDNKYVLTDAFEGKTAIYLYRINASNIWNAYIDYVEVSRPASLTSITPANAKSTYVTTTPLDFSGVAGLKAYVATAAAGGSVTLAEVGAVPAGTPLMLIGTAGTEYTVPVAASASAPAVNMFRAGDGTTTFNGSTFDYILFSDGKFYQIGSGSVPVGKAYLHCTSDPTTAGAPALSIIIDGEDINGNTTGIDSVKASHKANGEYYNLAGQRVANPAKGLYIVNGKKYMVK